MKTKLILLLAVAAGCIVPPAVINASPQYTAQATFSINWNLMAAGDTDFNPQKASREFNEKLARFKVSNQFVSLLCDDCKIPNDQSANIINQLSQNLHVKRVGRNHDGALYQITFIDSDQDIALKTVNLLNHRFVDRFNRQAQLRNVKNGFSSYKDNADSREHEQQLRGDLANLSELQKQEYSQERADRIQDIQGQLDGNNVQTMVSGIKMLANIVGLFSNPAKIQQDGLVKTL